MSFKMVASESTPLFLTLPPHFQNLIAREEGRRSVWGDQTPRKPLTTRNRLPKSHKSVTQRRGKACALGQHVKVGAVCLSPKRLPRGAHRLQ